MTTSYERPGPTKPKTFTNPEPCGWCARPAKKATDRHYSSEPYAGNLIVIRTTKSERNGVPYYTQSIWDGETYVHPYGFFCSQPCGLKYANMMWRHYLETRND